MTAAPSTPPLAPSATAERPIPQRHPHPTLTPAGTAWLFVYAACIELGFAEDAAQARAFAAADPERQAA